MRELGGGAGREVAPDEGADEVLLQAHELGAVALQLLAPAPTARKVWRSKTTPRISSLSDSTVGSSTTVAFMTEGETYLGRIS